MSPWLRSLIIHNLVIYPVSVDFSENNLIQFIPVALTLVIHFPLCLLAITGELMKSVVHDDHLDGNPDYFKDRWNHSNL
ncbi:hypothetical protein J7M02_01665 [Candidatus Aerophobetes bacterium]|nr:hypothetical protein [Candidatus Aerophobetes bacterium]